MRPLKLTIDGLGPYGTKQVLNFNDLEGHNLFLINGKTGAGKTTLLDAICFALYGETSDAQRPCEQLRSHFIGPNDKPMVEFEFAIGGSFYRAQRTLSYERPKTRGAGTRTEEAKAELCCITGVGGDVVDVEATGLKEVTRAVSGLLGFNCEQFRQVVVLPQGKFRDLLLARVTEREEILRILFRTDEFQRIENILDSAAKSLKKDIEKAEAGLAGMLQPFSVTTIGALVARGADCAAAITALTERIAVCRQEEAEARELLVAGEQAKQKLQKLAEAKDALATLAKQEQSIETKRLEFRAAKRAETLIGVATLREQQQKELRDAERIYQDLCTAYPIAEASCIAAQDALAIERQNSAVRDEAQRNLGQYERLQTMIDALEESRKQLSMFQNDLRATTQAQYKLQSERDSLQAQVAAQNAELAVCKQAADQLLAHRSEYERAQEVYDTAVHYYKLTEQLARSAADRADAEQGFQNLLTARKEAIETLRSYETTWSSGQAALLAQQLAPDHPCPVCGALDHPQPATAEYDIPSQVDIDIWRNKVDGFNKDINNAQSILNDINFAHTTNDAKQQTLGKQLGTWRNIPVEDLCIRRDKLQRAIFDAETATAQHDILLAEIIELQDQEKQLESNVNDQNEYGQALTTKVVTAQATVNEREQAIPEELRTQQALEQAIHATTDKVKQLEQALCQTEEKASAAQAALIEAKTQRDVQQRTVAQMCERLTETQGRFEEQLHTADFADEDAYELAIRSKEAITDLEQAIQGFDQALVRAQILLEQTKAEAAELDAPDVDALKSAAAAAKQALENDLREEGRYKHDLEQIGSILEQARVSEASITKLRQRYGVLGMLATVANGNEPNRRKISFHRYVLEAYLDDVLQVASQRLQRMSNRYQFSRSQHAYDRRRQGGLELEVFDSHTGQLRKVSTLSGGESFLAALALALGLVDVVQNHNGGMQLDTVFIDEGFGSLDENTLQECLHTLTALQQGGRLVGIISHITELQRQIPAHLRVDAEPSGSTARFRIFSMDMP